MNRTAIPTIIAASHAPHALHAEPRAFVESNCYVDLWIEVVHALGLEPLAMLTPALAVDFEGDQWTFIKPGHEDLRQLYGLDVQELQIWDDFADQIEAQVARGRIVIAEVDAHYLPDTAGTTYHENHEKTTIAIERIDRARRRIGYFHNAGYFTLDGDDFDGLLACNRELPPYVEFAKLEQARALDPAELRKKAYALLVRDLGRRPRQNPVRSYVAEFAAHARYLPAGDVARFHRYAFATLRQAGSAFELASRCLRFIDPEGFDAPAGELAALAEACKATLLKLARAVQRSRTLELGPVAEEASRWDVAFQSLEARVARHGAEAA